MDRRAFIRGLAAALPAGAMASQVAAQTDPVQAAYLMLIAAVEEGMPDGMHLNRQMFFVDGRLRTHAFPTGYQSGDAFAAYDSRSGWEVTS